MASTLIGRSRTLVWVDLARSLRGLAAAAIRLPYGFYHTHWQMA